MHSSTVSTFTEKKKDEQRHLVVVMDKRTENKNLFRKIPQVNKDRKSKHANILEIRILPVVKDSSTVSPYFGDQCLSLNSLVVLWEKQLILPPTEQSL